MFFKRLLIICKHSVNYINPPNMIMAAIPMRTAAIVILWSQRVVYQMLTFAFDISS